MNNKLVISLLALLVIVLAGFAYVLSSNTLESTKTFEREITKVEESSESNEVDDIEMDLSETDVDNVDKELSDIEAEIN